MHASGRGRVGRVCGGSTQYLSPPWHTTHAHLTAALPLMNPLTPPSSHTLALTQEAEWRAAQGQVQKVGVCCCVGVSLLCLHTYALHCQSNPHSSFSTPHSLVKFRHLTTEQSRQLKPKTNGPWSRKCSANGGLFERCVSLAVCVHVTSV